MLAHIFCRVSFSRRPRYFNKLFSQISESSFAHCSRDSLDGGEERVEEHSEGPSGRSNLSLLVEHEAGESHGIHAHLVDGQRGSRERHGERYCKSNEYNAGALSQSGAVGE